MNRPLTTVASEPVLMPFSDTFQPEPRGPEKLQELQGRVAYWEHRLADAALLNLPLDKAIPASLLGNLDWKSLPVPDSLRDSLLKISLAEQVPLPVVMLAAFHVLLARYTAQEDIVMSCSIPGV